MEYIEIDGDRELSGEITLSGSKNSALPILACSLLSDKSINLSNIPDLLDIKSMINLIESLGADRLLYGTIGSDTNLITVRVPGKEIFSTDQKIGLQIPEDAIHLFDMSSGKRLN